jgi:DNA polymerase III subunit epsilon
MHYKCQMMVTENDILQKKQSAILLANKLVSQNTLILDTETTGLGKKDEIVELSIITVRGEVLVNSLVKPTILMPPSASAIHGISNLELSNAPYITSFLKYLVDLFSRNYVAIYNAAFDLRLLKQSLFAHKTYFPKIPSNIYCVMEMYAMFNGEYDEIYKRYRWISLSTAAAKLGIIVSGNLHRAMVDVELTRQIILKIASTIP